MFYTQYNLQLQKKIHPLGGSFPGELEQFSTVNVFMQHMYLINYDYIIFITCKWQQCCNSNKREIQVSAECTAP